MSLSSLSFTWIWVSLIVSRVQKYLKNMAGKQVCLDLNTVQGGWRQSRQIIASLGPIGISNRFWTEQKPEFICHHVLSISDETQIMGSFCSLFLSQLKRESAMGDFLFLGKSSSQWEEQQYKKRSVCGSGAHSLTFQDEASPAYGASAHLVESLLCTDRR